MDFKGWGDLDTRQWWLAVLVIAGSLLIGAGSTGHITVATIAAGVVAWAFGEWGQHPFQQFRKDGHIGSHYNRSWNVFGTMLNVATARIGMTDLELGHGRGYLLRRVTLCC
jgi:hypothetical protein